MSDNVRGWCLVNATGRGKPIPVPGSFRFTKRQVQSFQDEQGYMAEFTVVRATLTWEAPRE